MSHDDSILIRPATRDDLVELGRLGAELVNLHHALDAQRFMRVGGDVAAGYARFLGSQLTNANGTVLVAVSRQTVCGYVYTTIEPRSWESLREEAGFIQDLIVTATERGRGVGTRLMVAALEWLRQRGVPRALLHTAVGNAAAQRLFDRLGFRPTMIEMTRELA
jgi:ribosomal protein S18 acetylase RimI-like enzyme